MTWHMGAGRSSHEGAGAPAWERRRGVPNNRGPEQARRWRLKAEECRALADQLLNPRAKASFRRMAETYDQLADQYEIPSNNPAAKKPEAS
jgi:hypothetical protein